MNVLRPDKAILFIDIWYDPIDYNRYNMDDILYNNNKARSLTSLRIAR